jgi:eukaryotic-like serine/threonine-protein kinase
MSSENLVGKMLGKYELREFLGRGGMGEIYRAFQSDLNREVALKVLRPELTSDREYVNRFRREAKTAAALEHPHIIPIDDSGSDQGV